MAAPRAHPGGDLSDREAEVFTLLGDRLTHAQIAARLFISVRTVESHVAALRRKLDLADRDALIAAAVQRHERQRVRGTLPLALTPFVGRTRELDELAAALTQSRLVTAVGPGGVGKTRLAIAVAERLTERFAGGICYVDLVPVSDPALVPSAVADALGTGEVAGRSTEQALIADIGQSEMLIMLDNCEHVVDAAARLAEGLLGHCPRLRILVTSRSRLVVPFEGVYEVPGLSLGDAGDAVTLFLTRVEVAGGADADLSHVADICRYLDGSALAIELAAAKLPSLGMDGLERGLADQMGLLTGGGRLQPRHRSLRDMLDWSYRLLGPVDQAILRRVCVFAAPFDLAAATDVASGDPADPIAPAAVAPALARLAEHSLVLVLPHAGGTRYRLLESVRQYSSARVQEAGDPVHARHLHWCLRRATELAADSSLDGTAWAAAFDAVADDLRTGLSWATENRPDGAHRLAELLGGLLFHRGRLGEAQRRYEQAAALADEPIHQARALDTAAAVAKCRVLGDDALRLTRAGADAYLRAGDPGAAAIALASAVELGLRFPGMFDQRPTAAELSTLSHQARSHAGDNVRARAALAVAWANSDTGADDAESADGVVDLERVLDGGTRAGSDLVADRLRSSFLDARMLHQIMAGAITDAARTASLRVQQLSALPTSDPAVAFELKDALHGAVFCATGAGDLTSALHFCERHLRLPFLREERDLAAEDSLYALALAGQFEKVLSLAGDYRDGWERSGSHVALGRGIGPAAVAMVHGIVGDDDGHAQWLHILARMRDVPDDEAATGTGYGELFEAIALLHNDHPEQAYDRLAGDGQQAWRFYGPLFRQWRAALRAEAAVLAMRHDAEADLEAAGPIVVGNPVATAILLRADALHVGAGNQLTSIATSFDAAGCSYQRDRTLALAHI